MSELPEGWEEVSIGEIAHLVCSGSTPRGGKKSYTEFGVIFLRSQNVHNDGLRLTQVAHIDPATHETMQRSSIAAGDVLLNITGASIGRSAIIPPKFPAANVNQHVCIIRLNGRGLHPEQEHRKRSQTAYGRRLPSVTFREDSPCGRF